MPLQPALTIHTGDITHLSKPAEFDLAQQMLGGLRSGELPAARARQKTITDPSERVLSSRLAKLDNRATVSITRRHFGARCSTCRVARSRACTSSGAAGGATADLIGGAASTPVVVFAHMPLWSIYEPWGGGTGDAAELISQLRRFGSVTILNGHIHQIVQKVEGTRRPPRPARPPIRNRWPVRVRVPDPSRCRRMSCSDSSG